MRYDFLTRGATDAVPVEYLSDVQLNVLSLGKSHSLDERYTNTRQHIWLCDVCLVCLARRLSYSQSKTLRFCIPKSSPSFVFI